MAVSFSGDSRSFDDGTFIVGENGVGTLRVDNGSVVTRGTAATTSFNFVGDNPGSQGTVTIDGTGSTLNLVGAGIQGMTAGISIGFEGKGRLDVTNGGRLTLRDAVFNEDDFLLLSVGEEANSTGTANFSDASFVMDGFNSEFVVGGASGARGTLTATASTLVVLGRGDSSFLGIGLDGADGSVTLRGGTTAVFRGIGNDDAPSKAFAGGQIADRGGVGSLTVLEGSRLTFTTDDDEAFLNVGRGDGGDASLPAARGTLRVDGDSTLAIRSTDASSDGGAFLNVGRDRATATAVVDGVVTVDAPGNLALANIGLDGGRGTLRVNEGGSLSIAAGGTSTETGFAEFRMGTSFTGAPTNGLAVFDGGDLTVTSANSDANVVIGREAAGTGTLRFLNGAEATVSGANASVLVGSAQDDADVRGTLLVSGGSTLTTDATSSDPFDAAVTIGDDPGQRGLAVVTGAGSTITTGAVLVGGNPLLDTPPTGDGTLNITAGGTVVADGIGVGPGGAINTTKATLDFSKRTDDDRDLLVEGGTHRMLPGLTTAVGDVTYGDGGTAAFRVAPGSNQSGRLRAVGEDSVISFAEGSRIVVETAGGAQFRGGEVYALVVPATPDGLDVSEGFDLRDDAIVTGQSATEFGYAFSGTDNGALLFRALNDGAGTRKALLATGATSNDAVALDYDTDERRGDGEGGFIREFSAANLDSAAGTAAADVLRATGSGDLDLFGQGGDDRLTGSDGANRLFGQTGDDVLIGNGGRDVLNGGAGNDRLFGGTGDDVLGGSVGADQLFGQAGDDRLFGGAGDDVLAGNLGTDVLRGDAGADRFVYSAIAESRVGAGDLIAGFVRGEDVIDLSAIDPSAAPGDQSLAFVTTFSGTGAARSGGEVRTVAGGVLVDVSGDGAIDMVIRTPGAGILAADDFVL